MLKKNPNIVVVRCFFLLNMDNDVSCTASYARSVCMDPKKKMLLYSLLEERKLLPNQNVFSWWQSATISYSDLLLCWLSVATDVPLERVFLPDIIVLDLAMYRHLSACTGITPYIFQCNGCEYVPATAATPISDDIQNNFSLPLLNLGSPHLTRLRERIVETPPEGMQDVNNNELESHSFFEDPLRPARFAMKFNMCTDTITFYPYHGKLTYGADIPRDLTFRELYGLAQGINDVKSVPRRPFRFLSSPPRAYTAREASKKRRREGKCERWESFASFSSTDEEEEELEEDCKRFKPALESCVDMDVKNDEEDG